MKRTVGQAQETSDAPRPADAPALHRRPRPTRSRPLLAVALLLGGLLVVALAAPGRPTSVLAQEASPPPTSVADLAARGRELYVQSCASCHGLQGQGGPYGPSVIGAGAAAYDFYLRTGRMPLAAPDEAQWRQEPVLSADAIAALTAYGATLGDGPAIPRVVTEGADLHRGWQLFLQNCASCHGTSGSGGAVGGGNVAPHLFRVDEVLTVEAMILGPGAMPVFLWPEEDLNAVAAYVRYLQQAPSPGGLPLGSVGPVPEGFIAGVLGLGVIVVLLRWIARGEERKRPDAEERAAEGPAA